MINPATTDIPFSTKLHLKLPRTRGLQREIVKLVRKEGAAITGSFAQKALLKRSRRFTDIDVVTKNVRGFAAKVKKQLGNKVTIKRVVINSPQGRFVIMRVLNRKGEVIADIDPMKFAEEGQIKKFPVHTVEGVKLISLRARLAAKIKQKLRGKKKKKIAVDIKQLTANRLRQPSGFLSKGGML